MFNNFAMLAPLIGHVKKQFNVQERELKTEAEITEARARLGEVGGENLFITAVVNGKEIRAMISAPAGALAGVLNAK
jgi:hypothetical protein